MEALFWFWLAGATVALALWLAELLKQIHFGVIVLDQEQLPFAALQAFTVALGMAAVWPLSAPIDLWRRRQSARGGQPEMRIASLDEMRERAAELDDPADTPRPMDFADVNLDEMMMPPLPKREDFERSLAEARQRVHARLDGVEADLKHHPCLLAMTEVHLEIAEAMMDQHYRMHGIDPDSDQFPFSRSIISLTYRLNRGSWAWPEETTR